MPSNSSLSEWICPRCANTGAYLAGRWLRCTVCAVTITDLRSGEEIAAAWPPEFRAEREQHRTWVGC